jgi:hypothetical protein
MEEHMLRVFENKVLRKKLGMKRDDMRGDRRKLHIEGVSRFILPSRHLDDQIKETEKKHLFGFLLGKLTEREVDVDGRIILKWVHKLTQILFYLPARHVSTHARPSSGTQTILKTY